MEKRIEIYDATLRHSMGSSEAGHSLEDRVRVLNALDEMGATFLEIGAPSEHPDQMAAYKRLCTLPLKNAKVVVTGGVRAKDRTAMEDPSCKALLLTGADVVSIWAQACDRVVREDKRVTLEENLRMISDTVNFFKRNGKMVLFQASHFFEGYASNHAYARDVICAAQNAGADRIILCESGLGSFPHEVFPIVQQMVSELKVRVGIHCHDAMSCAVASSLTAVRAGATLVQGTMLGIEPGSGNTNLSTMLPILQLREGYSCIQASKMSMLTQIASLVAEVCNYTIPDSAPFVGKNAFSFRYNPAMDHYNGREDPTVIQPEMVGNIHSGTNAHFADPERLLELLRRVAPSVVREQLQEPKLIERYGERVRMGYQYETAEASMILFLLREIGNFHSLYEISSLRLLDELPALADESSVVAYMKLRCGQEEYFTAIEQSGLIAAIWGVMSNGLRRFFPEVARLHLVNYRVRLTDTIGKNPRVSLDITDGKNRWSTAGISKDLVGAVFEAAQDAFDYGLMLTSNTK